MRPFSQLLPPDIHAIALPLPTSSLPGMGEGIQRSMSAPRAESAETTDGLPGRPGFPTSRPPDARSTRPQPCPATLVACEHMYLSCLSFLGYVLFARRRIPLPFGYLPLCALALLTVGGFATALAGHFPAYRTGAGVLGLALLAATAGESLLDLLRERRRRDDEGSADRAARAALPANSACLL